MNKQLPLLAVLGGAAAFCLRLWQNRTGFESDTGLPIPGAPAGVVLPVFLAAIAVVLLLLVRRLPREADGDCLLPRDFSVEDSRLLFLPVAGILLMAAAGLADLYEGFGLGSLLAQLQAAADPYAAVSSASVFSPGAQKLLGLLSLLSAGALFPAIAACRQGQRETDAFRSSPLLLVPPVALVVRLVLVYRVDSVNPVLGAYYVELLALVFLTLGFYRLSGFAFRAGRTRMFAFYACSAVVLCLASLADGGPCLSTLLLNLGGGTVLLGFLLLRLAAPASPPEELQPETLSES